MRVEFDHQIEGNAKIRDLKFTDRVRCVYGKVQRWDEVVEDGTRRGNDAAEMSCQTLRMATSRWNGQQALHFEALGNIYIQSEQFDAHAARLTYDQHKDLMVLHGDPRGGAMLRYAQQPGSDPVPLNADRIKFWPGKMDYEIEGFRSLNLGIGR